MNAYYLCTTFMLSAISYFFLFCHLGQLIRSSLSLSSLLNIPVRISKIRENRPNKGLAAQHLEGARVLSSISQGKLAGDSIGSTKIEFTPGSSELKPFYRADCGTAGAISLLIQISMPCLLLKKSLYQSTDKSRSVSTVVEYKGGTNVSCLKH